MRVVQFDNVAAFGARVTPFLIEREAENCFTLGRLSELSGVAGHEPPPLMWIVEAGDGRAVAAATMSSRRESARQHPVVVTRTSPAAVDALVDHLFRTGVHPPGVTAPDPTAGEFTTAWCARTGRGQRLVHALGLYHLTRVRPPRPVGGNFRPAAEHDAPRLVEWAEDFYRELQFPESRPHCEKVTADRIREGRSFLWCDPERVSVATWAGRTPNGVRINFVYTPPQYRGRGYASACVAALTQRMLDAGRHFCFLFTDLANPTSNHIYRAIGYEHLADFKHIDFAD
jgi:GNAT superfamily N-acetyltransferase